MQEETTTLRNHAWPRRRGDLVTKTPKDVGACVRARLLNLAQKRGEVVVEAASRDE
jgi:hypothetical protein